MELTVYKFSVYEFLLDISKEAKGLLLKKKIAFSDSSVNDIDPYPWRFPPSESLLSTHLITHLIYGNWYDFHNDWWRTHILLREENISPLMVNTLYLHYWSIYPGQCNLPWSSLQHFVLTLLMSHPLEENLPCNHQLQVGYRPFVLQSHLLL